MPFIETVFHRRDGSTYTQLIIKASYLGWPDFYNNFEGQCQKSQNILN